MSSEQQGIPVSDTNKLSGLFAGAGEMRALMRARDWSKTARELRPEIVLCDIGLPGMDGFDVARAFRADAALKQIFLVALTGYALPEDIQRALSSGFHQHLAKPPDLAKLEQVLAQAARV